MLTGIPFSVNVNQDTHCAYYYLAGGKVIVISDYGEGGAEVGTERPERVARRVLSELVRRGAEQRMAMSRRGA
jgi:hypothetical protein